MKRSLLIALVAVQAFIVGGCQTMKRPVTAIRQDADWQYERGNWEAARDGYSQIVERYPGDWQAQYRLGQCQLVLRNPTEAKRALGIAHTRNPDNEKIADALAEAMYQLGQEESLFSFLNERAKSTQSVHAWLRLAHYAMETGDADTAKVAVNTAISLDDGKTVDPYLCAADFAEQIGDPDGAVKRLRQAYGIDPTDERVKQRLIALGEVPGPTLALPPNY